MVRQLWKAAPSLKPSVGTMDAYIDGDLEAEAIIEAWRFQPNRGTRIVYVTSEEHAAMAARTEGIAY
ncbi:MAG: hypothetical protein PW792_08190 [Acidobacteriaceae bacterium]|nr:hypothetical protein [Acidobacteriaceae bacterium]